MTECGEIVIDNGREKLTVHAKLLEKCPSLLKKWTPGEPLRMPDRSAEEIRQLLDLLDGRQVAAKWCRLNLDLYRRFGIPVNEVILIDDFIDMAAQETEQYEFKNGYRYQMISSDWFDNPTPWCGRWVRWVPCVFGCYWANWGSIRFNHPDLSEPIELRFWYETCDTNPSVSRLVSRLKKLGWSEAKIVDLRVGRVHWDQLQRRRARES